MSYFSYNTDHIKAISHPMKVHPANKFSRKIASAFFLCLAAAMIDGKKYKPAEISIAITNTTKP
jgi:hypothetical protein